MHIPTEPIGSIPRPAALIDALAANGGKGDDPALEPLFAAAVRDTLDRFEATGSPVVTDGEQRKVPGFWDYSVAGAPHTAPDGFLIPFGSSHGRRMPRLTSASRSPFRYRERGDRYVEAARRDTALPIKQAVISPSALSLLYPAGEIASYPREDFLEDLVREHVSEVRACLEKGAHGVQIDFTEGPLAIELDPTGVLLGSFIDLNNLALARFSKEQRAKIGLHTCPGQSLGSRTDARFEYADLLPLFFQMEVTNFYIALACATRAERRRVLAVVRDHLRPGQRAFVGVVSPSSPVVETAEEVRDRVLEAAEYIPVERLGTTDDCGFAPFSDDLSASRDVAFAKIAARVRGTALAEKCL